MESVYLHIKSGANGPFQTIKAQAKRAPMAHHRAGLQWTATGYGRRIPTEIMVLFNGRWWRVYCRVFSNIGTLYIGKFSADQSIIVQEN